MKFPEITVPETTITITYKAKVTKDAIFETVSTNTAKLDADNNPSIGQDTVEVYNYQLSIDKFIGDKNDPNATSGTALQGAVFSIYENADATGSPLRFVPHSNADKTETYYTLADADETANVVTELTTDAQGNIDIRGLADATYYIKEVKAPNGYNLLEDIIEFKPTVGTDGHTATNVTVPVPNYAGSTLPSTGGMGTTMIYIAGAILMVGAAIIFVTNKRMKHE